MFLEMVEKISSCGGKLRSEHFSFLFLLWIYFWEPLGTRKEPQTREDVYPYLRCARFQLDPAFHAVPSGLLIWRECSFKNKFDVDL